MCKLDVPVIAAKEVEVIVDDLISSVKDMDRLTNDANIKKRSLLKSGLCSLPL